MSFNDKVVIVTGASSGIGAATALKFAAKGAKVVMIARNEKKLKDVSEKCEKIGSKPLVIIADVTKDEDTKRIVRETVDKFGKLDVLVNNAGIANQTSILSEDFVQSFDNVMSVNLRSVAVLTNLAAPYLVKTKGNIINISSMTSLRTIDVAITAYVTSKAGLDHFTRSVAFELAPKGVRVNTVNPGIVKTDIAENAGMAKDLADKMYEEAVGMTALGRIGEPEEIADLVVFLASDKAKSITGSSYVSDNGSLLKLGKLIVDCKKH